MLWLELFYNFSIVFLHNSSFSWSTIFSACMRRIFLSYFCWRCFWACLSLGMGLMVQLLFFLFMISLSLESLSNSPQFPITRKKNPTDRKDFLSDAFPLNILEVWEAKKSTGLGRTDYAVKKQDVQRTCSDLINK